MLTKIALAVVPLSLVGAVMAMASCAGTLENPDQFTDGGASGPSSSGSAGCTLTDFDMEARLKDTSTQGGCAQAGAACHGAGSEYFDFLEPDLVGRLIGATSATMNCGGDLLVDPEDPTASVMYLKLAGQDCGSQMPFTQEAFNFSEAELACAAEWISELEGGGPGAGGSGSGGTGSGGEGGGTGGAATGGTGGR